MNRSWLAQNARMIGRFIAAVLAFCAGCELGPVRQLGTPHLDVPSVLGYVLLTLVFRYALRVADRAGPSSQCDHFS